MVDGLPDLLETMPEHLPVCREASSDLALAVGWRTLTPEEREKQQDRIRRFLELAGPDAGGRTEGGIRASGGRISMSVPELVGLPGLAEADAEELAEIAENVPILRAACRFAGITDPEVTFVDSRYRDWSFRITQGERTGSGNW
jgi:hypothetical protein